MLIHAVVFLMANGIRSARENLVPVHASVEGLKLSECLRYGLSQRNDQVIIMPPRKTTVGWRSDRRYSSRLGRGLASYVVACYGGDVNRIGSSIHV